MSWKKISVMALVCSLLLVSMVSVTVSASAMHHVYPGDSIQAVVDAASVGDTIVVHKGEYHQSVKIWKDDITLIGEKGAILDGTLPADPGTVFEVGPHSIRLGIWLVSGVSGVTIEGFEIRDYGKEPDWGCAIWLESGSHDNYVIENKLTGDTFFGIMASTSNDNLIMENKVSKSYYGIMLERGSDDNEVIENEVKNSLVGIGLDEGSTGNLIMENKVSKSSLVGIGIAGIREPDVPSGNILSSDNNQVIENTVTGSGQFGIALIKYASDNLIKGNKVSGSGTYDLCELAVIGDNNRWEDNKYHTFGIDEVAP